MNNEVLGTLEEQVVPKQTALLIIDPQNDFCASDGAVSKIMGTDASRNQRAVPRLNRFIERAREEHLLIVWTKSIVEPYRARVSFKARGFIQDARGKNINFVQEGTNGADWYPAMTKPLPEEHVITKYHYDAFADTNLDLLLSSMGMKTLLFTGFNTNVCVETAARHAYIKGYYVIAVADCTDTVTEQEYDAALFNIKTYFGKVATSEQIAKIWNARQK
ncbi:MAG: cysteine hydrolase [Deltaproteobacteria bacterium]|nr:cysteine hydrolase [Deltaproteobacteria bacterium]